jgi:phosphatidylglycerol:prolipoprotein diacylglycerol transferase
MSFHGGFIGCVLAVVLFARRRKIPILSLGDVTCAVAPIGLFFGRLANFINGELYGRPSNVSWAMIFPNGGPVPRHPSQLYEAFCEGILLFILLFAAERLHARERPGVVTGLFLAGYAAARMSGEVFREPDPQLGFLIFGTTMGQLLSIPLLIAGILIIAWALRAPVPARS